MFVKRRGLSVVLAVAVVASACGPSASDRASERLDAAWSATERLDPSLAEAELRAAIEISEPTAEPVRSALEARIAAVRFWNEAQTALVASDYLAAIEAFTSAATMDDYFRTRAVRESQSAEQAYVQRATGAIEAALDAGDVDAAFAELSVVHGVFPENPALAPVRQFVAAAFLPILAEEVEPVIVGDRPEEARERLSGVVSVLGAESEEAQALKARIDEAVAKVEAARRAAAAEEQRRRAEAARLAAEEARKARDAVFARIGCVRDELERRERCYDNATYSRTASNRLYFYTTQIDGQKPTLTVRLQTRGRRWIFWEWARVYVGDQTFDIDPPWRDLVRDNGGGDTWESYARRANAQDLRMMMAIADRGEAFVRFVNKDGIYREHKLTAAQIRGVQNMAAYWKEVG